MNTVDKKNRKDGNPKIVINQHLKDHGDDPFFIQKAEASKKVIEKYGLPKQLTVVKK